MSRLYCSKEDVKKYLPPNINVEGDNPTPNYLDPTPDSVFNIDIDYFIEQACDEIDAALATIYDVPLNKINFDGSIVYPKPIPELTAIFAAARIFEQRLQGAERQSSEVVKDRLKWAYDQLNQIQNGQRRLYGVRNTRGDRFIRQTLRNIPKNPAEGGRSRDN